MNEKVATGITVNVNFPDKGDGQSLGRSTHDAELHVTRGHSLAFVTLSRPGFLKVEFVIDNDDIPAFVAALRSAR